MNYHRHFDEVYVNINGSQYYGWKGTIIHTSEYYIKKVTPGVIATNRTVTELLGEKKIDLLLDENFKPQSGDPVHIVPDCKYSIADIRNNYKVKRDFDSGVCNVFSPFKNPETGAWIDWTVSIPSRQQLVFIGGDCKSARDAFYRAKEVFPDLQFNDCVFHDTLKRVFFTKKLKPYVPLLLHNAKKPCISYKNLEFNTNELTTDVLMLVKKTGEIRYDSPDAEKNFTVQLAVLNQHNWREYPRTVKNLFNTITDYKCIKEDVFSHPSKYPKYIKEMYDLSRKPNPPYSEKDFNLTREFYMTILEINQETMFVDTKTLQEKLNSAGISLGDFNQIFNLVTRITPKRYDA